MNSAFWLLLGLGAVALWFLISIIFIPIGTLLIKKWNKTLEILNKEIENNEDEKGEEEHE